MAKVRAVKVKVKITDFHALLATERTSLVDHTYQIMKALFLTPWNLKVVAKVRTVNRKIGQGYKVADPNTLMSTEKHFY